MAWHSRRGRASGHRLGRVDRHGRHLLCCPAQAGGSLAAKLAGARGKERAARSSAEVVMAGGPIREHDEMRSRGTRGDCRSRLVPSALLSRQDVCLLASGPFHATASLLATVHPCDAARGNISVQMVGWGQAREQKVPMLLRCMACVLLSSESADVGP